MSKYLDALRGTLLPEICVAIVSNVVTPSETRAGMDVGSSQKDTHDTTTSMQHGM